MKPENYQLIYQNWNQCCETEIIIFYSRSIFLQNFDSGISSSSCKICQKRGFSSYYHPPNWGHSLFIETIFFASTSGLKYYWLHQLWLWLRNTDWNKQKLLQNKIYIIIFKNKFRFASYRILYFLLHKHQIRKAMRTPLPSCLGKLCFIIIFILFQSYSFQSGSCEICFLLRMTSTKSFRGTIYLKAGLAEPHIF